MMLLELKRIHVPPGQKVLLQDVTWQELETILAELEEHRAVRIAYDKGTLEFMALLPEQEYDKEIIGDLIKALLEELDMEFIRFDFTTLKNQDLAQSIEPELCFYIRNNLTYLGSKQLDLTVVSPPDLALELDIISRTHVRIYESLKVPELWRFYQGKLQIKTLQNGVYAESPESLLFPGFPLTEVISQYLRQSFTADRNTTIEDFRLWVRQQIQQL